MNNMSIERIIVIQAGGQGKRLWPISTDTIPKQFIKFEEYSLFQQTCLRVRALFKNTSCKVVIIGNIVSIATLKEQCSEINFIPDIFIIQPSNRETATILLNTAFLIQEMWGKKSCIHFMPSDHVFSVESAVYTALKKGENAAEHSDLVGYGIEISTYSNQYGCYITNKTSKDMVYYNAVEFRPNVSIDGLVEMQGQYSCFWDCGILTAKAEKFIHLFQSVLPDFSKECFKSYQASKMIENNILLDEDYYAQIKPISIAQSLMPYVDAMSVIDIETKWADVGSWKNFFQWYADRPDDYITNTIRYIANNRNMTVSVGADSAFSESYNMMSLITNFVTISAAPDAIDELIQKKMFEVNNEGD